MRAKPPDWPKYMLPKRLKSGAVSYYWNPPKRDLDAGFTLGPEPLGPSYGDAMERANLLYRHLVSWRRGLGIEKVEEAQPGYGTLGWLFDKYRRSRVFKQKVSERSRPGYERSLREIENVSTTTGTTVAHLRLASITPRAVDRIYTRLQKGPRKKDRTRQANHAIDIARRAWSVVRRLYPNVVPAENPWVGVERVGTKTEKPAATRAEAYALAKALFDMGEAHLGAAALVCFEWHQRPEHVVLEGKMRWTDLRPSEMPCHVKVEHPKTRVAVWMPLEDEQGRLYPEIEDYLRALPKLGTPIVLTAGRRGPPRPYSAEYAQRKVREARTRAGLGSHVTLDACRHGGMTELGDAEVTEQGVMALSGHKTPQAARGYIKHTDIQRRLAARRRRAWVNSNETGAGVRKGGQT